jgi:hypothetical protein
VYKEMFNGKVDSARLGQVRRALPDGIYVLKITGEGFAFTDRFQVVK